ncbi:MAG: hypothetical protein PVH96_02405 [Gemmatimonadota bacterium]|jgi:hypothetical protein
MVIDAVLTQVNSDLLVTTHEAPGMVGTSPIGMLFANGSGVFWTLTFILVIVHGFREQRPMIPTVAILLNVSWEILAVFHWPAYNTQMKYGSIAWLTVDVVIVYQLLRYGAAHQRFAEIRKHWRLTVLSGLLLALVGHEFFSLYNADEFGLEDSFLINLIMSVLFIRMYFEYRDTSKLARWIAWSKMLGTAMASVGLTLIMASMPTPPPRSPLFLYYLMVACFLFDTLYVGLLVKARGTAPTGAAVPA